MSVMDIPPAGESPPTAMGETPPDQEGMTLRDHCRAIVTICGRDGQITPDEQFELRAMMEGLLGIARAREAAGQSPLGAPQQQGAPDQSTEGPYMGHAGTMQPAGV